MRAESADDVVAAVRHALEQHGLACLHGSAPDVGVVGYTLGGRLSFYGRRYGTVASLLPAAEPVLADGAFGIVTALEFELCVPGPIRAGLLFFGLERAREVVRAWSCWAPMLTQGTTTVARLLRVPDPTSEDGPPPALRGKAFAVVETVVLGDTEEADALLAPMRALGPVMDTTHPTPVDELQHLHMDPPSPVPSAGDGFGMPAFPEAAVDAFVDSFGEALIGAQTSYGGEQLAYLGGPFQLFAVGIASPAARADLAGIEAARSPYAGGRRSPNFVEDPAADPAGLWDAETLARLRAVKAACLSRHVTQGVHSPLSG